MAYDMAKVVALNHELVLRASIVTWSRLEPLGLTRGDLTPGLRAAVADPLWFAARQWQFGELHAEDAGSPITVAVDGTAGPMTRFHAGRLGPDPAGESVDFPAIPLETAVEAETPAVLPERIRAEAGQHLLRLVGGALAALGAPVTAQVRAALLASYAFAPADAALAGNDPEGAARRGVLAGRVVDAARLMADLAGRVDGDGAITDLPPALAGLPAADQLRDALTAWNRWYASYLAAPVGAGGGGSAPFSWDPYRQEYSFAVQGRTGSGDVLLTAEEYTDGRLDWYDFAATAGPSLAAAGAADPATTTIAERQLVSPVRFPGMPADRLFEFEDTRVYLGRLNAGPHDIARLGLVEFALAYGNDWFLAPVDLPYGSVCEVSSVAVRDTFGEEITVPRATQPYAGRPGWCMYHLTGAEDAGRLSDVFVLPPTVAGRLESEPVEEVVFFRDEQADIVWGVERVVPGETGEPVPWHRLAAQVSLRQSVPDDLDDAKLVYRLMSPLPENWIPFVAVPAKNRPAGSLATDLQRQPLIRFAQDGTVSLVHPRGTVLRTSDTADVTTDRLRIAEEEVPRDGIVVRRTFQLARTVDGRSVLWLGRSKTTGTGEGFSGLRFDTALPPRGV